MPNSTTDGLKPTYLNTADYYTNTSDWETKDSITLGYNSAYKIVYGNQYRNNGNGLEFTNYLSGFCAPPYSLTVNFSFAINRNTANPDSFIKTEIYYMGQDKDSVVEFEYDKTNSFWRIKRTNYYEYYPGVLKTHT